MQGIRAFTIFSFFVLGFVGESMAEKQKQTMPIPSLWRNFSSDTIRSPKTVQSHFLEDVHGFEAENHCIPEKDNHLRLVNFNVRMWTTIHEEPNFDAAQVLIQQFDADILVLQEVVNWEKTYAQLVLQGYNMSAAHCVTQNPPFCPAIFVKNGKVAGIKDEICKAQMNPKRQLSYVRMDLLCGTSETPLAVYGLHLEVDQKQLGLSTEDVRLQQLSEIIEDTKTLHHKNVIIAGDFNSVQQKDYAYMVNGRSVWDMLNASYAAYNVALEPQVLDCMAQEGYLDSFAFLGWQGPKFTNWASCVLDFVYVPAAWQRSEAHGVKPVASYVYYTDVSDHLPIIVDFQVD